MSAPRKALPTNTWRVTVDADLALRLEAYCRAQTEETDRLPVIRKAIRMYLDQQLKRDRKMLRRYEVARAEIIASLPAELRPADEKGTGGRDRFRLV